MIIVLTSCTISINLAIDGRIMRNSTIFLNNLLYCFFIHFSSSYIHLQRIIANIDRLIMFLKFTIECMFVCNSFASINVRTRRTKRHER